MDAGQLEALFVCGGCTASGVLLLAIAPERLPAPLPTKPENRFKWGVLLILLGVGMSVYTVLGGR